LGFYRSSGLKTGNPSRSLIAWASFVSVTAILFGLIGDKLSKSPIAIIFIGRPLRSPRLSGGGGGGGDSASTEPDTRIIAPISANSNDLDINTSHERVGEIWGIWG